MSTSRRDFLKTTMIAGAGMAIPAMAEPTASGGAESLPAAEGQLSTAAAQGIFTRGIGMYPGSPSENFSPELVIDNTYRNIALLRPAYHSSAYDYSLTAQLVTDGIKDTHRPTWVGLSTNRLGMLPKTERETLLDHFPTNVIPLLGTDPSVQVELGGGESLPAVDRIAAFVTVMDRIPAEKLSFTVSVSDDGRLWREVGRTTHPQPVAPDAFPPDLARGAQLYFPSIPLREVCHNRYYEVRCELAGVPADSGFSPWGMGQIEFYEGNSRVQVGGPYSFTSAWMSAGSGEEWVYVDLGARCEFDHIALYWIARAAEGTIQVSDDAKTWRELKKLTGTGPVDDIKLAVPAHGRYVRVLMTRPTSPDGYQLSEIEVFGRGGPVAKPKSAASFHDGQLDLAGGSWKLQRLSSRSEAGESLSKSGFKDTDWIVATVPGTVLTSYVNVGAVQDPNFGQNQLHISDSYFYSDFWYRTEFEAPTLAPAEVAWLNFDGINWKADIFLNGEKLGRIEGGFMRGRFDVTGKLIAGKPNALAVKIEKNATPGSAKQKTWENPSKNGGALGADNPTYHASIGWDWIPTIRGRNIGIWGDVFLSVTGAVTLENHFVSSKLALPEFTQAEVSIDVDIVNHTSSPVSGTLRGRFGESRFEQKVSIPASGRNKVSFNPSNASALHIQNPKLWWPVGYGEPDLYDVELTFETSEGKPSDSKTFKAGIRQFTYNEDGGALRIFINGRRFVARGGNWGFGESMLLYRAREYDAAVRYHREMNFTMVRNWVGQIGDEAFYQACDRHGVVVWQDFWLANPWDGPNPDNDALFLANARDFVSRIRSHASIGLYCGRNEGFPPKPLDDGIRALLAELHPGIQYIGSSADEVVSGHGPYNALPPTLYFRVADSKLHSEIGMPNIPPIESVRAMMPESAIWPQGLDWGLHDFSMTGAQGGSSFLDIIKDSYGGAHGGEEWVTLAQFVNYEGYRAIFESQSKYRMGVLLWMSHPCWPSFVWQTYDYYFEPTAAYFGCKKGSEPLHIQWNRTTESIEVVNYSGGQATGLTAHAEILNMDAKPMWTKTATLNSSEDSTSIPIVLESVQGLSPVHFLRLTLTRGKDIVSNNFYLRGAQEGDYRAIRQLPMAHLHVITTTARKDDRWILTTELSNISATPAIMTRLKVVRDQKGDRILPAIYSDNYIALMPGEKRSITTELNHADTRGEKPRIVVGGFNVESA
jgi:Exo-beta-D-glucosaminidase Ig-fold domain/Glycosyl hydrolases family 2/F5/8 type C domain